MKSFNKKRVGSHAAGDIHSSRIRFVRGCALVLSALLIVRLFSLQVIGYAAYKDAADGEHGLYKKLFPVRGKMYVRDQKTDQAFMPLLENIAGMNVFPAVTNRDMILIYADPRHIQDTQKTAEALAGALSLDAETISEKLRKKNDAYEVIARAVPDEIAKSVKELGLDGIYFTTERKRYYPQEGLGGHIFGFVGEKGYYGLEGYFDEMLRGKEGSLRLETDAIGTLIPLGNNIVVDAIHGSDLVLTIDRTVQLVTCDKLKKWVEQHGADGGSIVIMDPLSGALMAMCSVPDFMPSDYSKSDINVFNNPAIFTPYEPGSIFKAFTMAIGLDTEVVAPTTVYDDTGSVKIGPYTIKNSDGKAHGTQTMMDVLDESLNTGTIFVARKVGLEKFRSYIKAFGFGVLSGIELDTESAGTIKSLEVANNEIYMATASFGQGLTTTPLQLAAAYGALANNGKLMRPYIVDALVRSDGMVIKTQPKEVRRVVSERTATLIGGMLVNVVRKGHGKRAGVEGYYVAGKTGTAQVPRKDGRGYEPNLSIGSFAGYAPVGKPRFVMVVRIDHPRDVQWAESSAAPLFGELARFLLQYYEISPDEKK